jgi:hypothetical protein
MRLGPTARCRAGAALRGKNRGKNRRTIGDRPRFSGCTYGQTIENVVCPHFSHVAEAQLDLHALLVHPHQSLRRPLGEPRRGHQQPWLARSAGALSALLRACTLARSGLVLAPLRGVAHQHEAGAQRIAAHPFPDPKRSRRGAGLCEQPLAAAPAVFEDNRGQTTFLSP